MDRKRRSNELGSSFSRSYSSQFFSVEYIKDKLYSTSVHNVKPMKRRKTSANCSVAADAFQNVWITLDDRLNKVVRP